MMRMRYVLPLLLVFSVFPVLAESPKKASAFLLKDINRYDPTVLPEDDRTAQEVKRIPKDQYFQKKLHKVKRARLNERMKRYADAVAAIGTIDDAASAKALCEVFAAAGDREVLYWLSSITCCCF